MSRIRGKFPSAARALLWHLKPERRPATDCSAHRNADGCLSDPAWIDVYKRQGRHVTNRMIAVSMASRVRRRMFVFLDFMVFLLAVAPKRDAAQNNDLKTGISCFYPVIECPDSKKIFHFLFFS